MDPLSITTAVISVGKLAKPAWDIGDALRNFIAQAKDVDKTVTELQSEAKGLGNACDVVREQLEELRDHYGNDFTQHVRGKAHEDPLWTSFSSELAAIKRTMRKFTKTLAGLNEEKSSFVGKAWKQHHLDNKTTEIAELRHRVHAHTGALQMVMLSFTIKVAHLAPRQANQELLERLQQLQQLKENSQITQPDENKVAIQYASKILSTGATLYEASIAGNSALGDMDGQSTAHVASWLSDIHALQQNQSVSDSLVIDDQTSPWSNSPSNFRTDLKDVNGGVRIDQAAVAITEADTDVADEATEEDWDDDLNIEVAQSVFHAGTEAFAEGDYYSANISLLEALSLIRTLPMDRQPAICDLRRLQYQLAVSTYHLEGPVAAEAAFLSLVQEMPRTTNDRILQCQAAHLLSQVFVRTRRLEQARQTCESALQARRKSLGKHHNETCCSLALLARVHELLGNQPLAKAYRSLIPEAEREAQIQSFADLDISLPRDSPKLLELDEIELKAYAELASLAPFDAQGKMHRSTAEEFLSCSELAEEVLGEIWRLADPESFGYLDWPRFCVLFRLIAHAQAGRVPRLTFASKPAPLPWIAGQNHYSDVKAGGDCTRSSVDPCWCSQTRSQLWDPAFPGVTYLTAIVASTHATVFKECKPQMGFISREVARRTFLRPSELSENLDNVLALVDPNSVDSLSQVQFVVAAHLIQSMFSHKHPVPKGIPQEFFDDVRSLIWQQRTVDLTWDMKMGKIPLLLSVQQNLSDPLRPRDSIERSASSASAGTTDDGGHEPLVFHGNPKPKDMSAKLPAEPLKEMANTMSASRTASARIQVPPTANVKALKLSGTANQSPQRDDTRRDSRRSRANAPETRVSTEGKAASRRRERMVLQLTDQSLEELNEEVNRLREEADLLRKLKADELQRKVRLHRG